MMHSYKMHQKVSILLLHLLHLLYISHCFDLLPMACNVSLTDSCPASLYYVPPQLKNTNETAFLFGVPSSAVRKTADGFLITVTCACPAEHREFIWYTAYSIQVGDTWKLISEKFGLLVMEKPEKILLASMNITLDFLCGCVRGVNLVTYTIQPGDTLFTICSRFGVDMEQVREVNKVTDVSKILAGDKLFIPATGIAHLIVPDDGSNFQSSSKSGTHVVLGIAIAAVMVFLIFAAMIFWIFYKRRPRKQNVAFLGGTKSSLFSLTSPSCAWRSSSRLKSRSASEGSKRSSRSFKSIKTAVFPYPEVCDATANFSESQKIGQGSYGCVYRGRLRGLVVAVKQMKNTKSKEFFAELNILCKVYHDNLIELIGYSSGADSLCLVYEFAQNGALSDHLHNPSAKGHKTLSWNLRVQIALDAAKGLEYIHVYIKPLYVHRDVKPSNILLDSDFRAKIADFGLVKLLEHSSEVGAITSKIVGTFGYLAPEYVRDGCVTPKTDVYAFGVVLMELITGKHALTRGNSVGNDQYVEHQSVVDCVLSALDDEHDPIAKLQEIIDSNLIHYGKDSVLQMALLSKDCVDDDWKRRPDMPRVVHRLSEIASSMERDEIKLDNSLY